MATLIPMPKAQFFGTSGTYSGKPLAGGQVYTCIPGGTISDVKYSYTDATEATANPSPVVLDSAGMANIWLSGFYKIFVYDAAGVLQYSTDNVSSASASGGTVSQWTLQTAIVPAYSSPTQFTATGSLASTFPIGTRVAATLSGGLIFGTVSNVVASGTPVVTTVTVIWDSGALDATLSAIATGLITVASNGLPIMPARVYSSSYSMTVTDINQVFIMYSASAQAFGLPAASSVPSGSWFRIKNMGVGLLTLTGTVDGTINPILNQYSEVVITSASGVWCGAVRNNTTLPVRSLTASYALLLSDLDQVFVVNSSSAVTITLPAANTLPSGAWFKIHNYGTGLVTISGTVDGVSSPTIQQGYEATIFTDSVNFYGTNITEQLQALYGWVHNPTPHFLKNINLSAYTSGNSLYFTLGAWAVIDFRNNYPTFTATEIVTTTNMTKIIAAGSTLGFTANLYGRIYLWAIYDAGSVYLGYSRTTTGFPEFRVVSTAADYDGSGANSPTTIYTTVAHTNCWARCLGYMEVLGGSTPGQWVNGPTLIEVMGPNVLRSGQVAQVAMFSNNSVAALSSTSYVVTSCPTVNQTAINIFNVWFAMNSAASMLVVDVNACIGCSNNVAGSATAALFNTTLSPSLAVATGTMWSDGAIESAAQVPINHISFPQTSNGMNILVNAGAGNTTQQVYVNTYNSAHNSICGSSAMTTIQIKEVIV